MHGEKRALYYVGRALDARLQTRLQERSWKVEVIEPGIVPACISGDSGFLVARIPS